jgi:hypothetical protein
LLTAGEHSSETCGGLNSERRKSGVLKPDRAACVGPASGTAPLEPKEPRSFAETVITNLVLIVISLIWLAVSWLHYHRRWLAGDFDLVDLYILFVGAYYAGVPLVNACLQDQSIYDSGDVVLIYVLFASSLVALRLLTHALPQRVREALDLRRIAAGAGDVALSSLATIVVLMWVFSFYVFRRYGVVSDSDLRSVLSSLPYWITTAKQVEYGGLIEGVFIGLWANVLVTQGRKKGVALILSAMVVTLQAAWGRRSVFELLVLGLLLWALARKSNPFAPRMVLRWALGFGLLFLFSNVYQDYRNYLFDPTAMKLSLAAENNALGEAAMDWKGTLSNIGSRGTDWEYDYMALETIQRWKPQQAMLLAQGIENEVPLFVWPSKRYLNPDEQFNAAYGYSSNFSEDYATNLFGLTLIDFGYFALLAFPLLLVASFALVGAMLNFTWRYPVLYVIMAGMALNSLLQIEGTYDSVLTLLRWAFLIFGNYVLMVLWNSLRSGNSPREFFDKAPWPYRECESDRPASV